MPRFMPKQEVSSISGRSSRRPYASIHRLYSIVKLELRALILVCLFDRQGIPKEEIPKFADSSYWLEFFPPRAIADMDAFGCKV
jgi:hypothetical protein